MSERLILLLLSPHFPHMLKFQSSPLLNAVFRQITEQSGAKLPNAFILAHLQNPVFVIKQS